MKVNLFAGRSKGRARGLDIDSNIDGRAILRGTAIRQDPDAQLFTAGQA